MGFYAPPLRDGASAVLAPGYVAPTAQQADASLSDAGAFRYRPSSRYAVDATLQPGYIAPAPSACDATLTRPLAGADGLRLAGFDACAFGGHDVRLARAFLTPAGFDSSEPGLPSVRNASERVLVWHPPQTSAELFPGYSPPAHSSQSAQLRRYGDYLEVGRHAIEIAGVDFVAPSGWLSQHFGQQADIRNKSRFVLAGAISPRDAYGTAWVSHYTRYLTPPGADTQAHGTQWASHYLRYITSPGVGDKTARGTPWVSRSPRTLEPSGPDMMRVFEAHTVGGTRYIEPVGTEMTEWGTRIIPEGQTLYPQGFAGDVGTHDVQLYTRYLHAQSFQTNHDDLRFGRQDVWNLRQIVQQDYDPNDGMNPPPFGQWTGIENRNKEPAPVGWLSERHGYTSIFNKAVVALPQGIAAPADAPTYKAGSITHRVRPLQLDGWDSAEQSRWAAVFNVADPLLPTGVDALDLGNPSIENRSRLYDKVGNFDSMAVGAPMVAERVRGLRIEERHTIEPPQIDLPEVKLHTRYVEYVSAGDKMGAGMPVLDIRWTYIAPKWAFHPPAWIGEPALRNVTPELRTGGMNHEEFGQASIRTQWRRVETKDGDMTQWGRPIVRDRRHWVEFVTVGAPPNLMPGPNVTKVGGLPDPQGVQPPGIAPSNGQVPPPLLNLLFSYPAGFDSLKFGQAVVTANSIRVEPGYWENLMGAHTIATKNRTITANPFNEVFQPSKAAVSPHTIWAVVEAPEQAIDNHEPRGLHYVDHDPLTNLPLKYVPWPTVALKNRRIHPSAFTWPSPYEVWPSPSIHNARRYVSPSGMLGNYFGVPSVPGAQTVEQFYSADMAAIGVPGVEFAPYVGPRTLAPGGIAPPAIAQQEVEFFQRTRQTTGWDSMRMGESKSGDTPFQWQGLRIGPLIPNTPDGFDAQGHGTPWVSLAVRDVPMQGWDSFECEYDIAQFDKRMRVTRTPTPKPPVQHIGARGAPPSTIGTPDLRAGRHYIRPDGNAEQYRKGAPQ